MTDSPKALVVLSGGQDSTTCLFRAVADYGRDNVHAITFDYNQRHAREIGAAREIANMAGVMGRHEVLQVGGILRGRSPLTDHSKPLEQYENATQMASIIGDRVELTFVPMRNALFLTLAANRASMLGATAIVTGVCEEDNANYPDCRASFIRAQENAINEALGNTMSSGHWVILETPLMYMSKAQSVALAIRTPGAYTALAYSHTAYDGLYPPTGKDHATILRAQGFEEAGVPDPLILRANRELLYYTLPQTPNYGPDRVQDALRHMRGEVDDFPSTWSVSKVWLKADL